MSAGGAAREPVTRFDLVNSIVEAAAEMPPGDREHFVEERCGGDSVLQQSVLRLLSAFNRMDSGFMERPPVAGLRVGEVLAERFHIVEKLGEGGMGSVYLAEDRELGEVALKIIRPALREDAEAIEWFRSEIRLARGIGHQNVCPVFELFRDEPTPAGPVTFFTMKYLKGETLAKRLVRGPLDVAEALRVARGIADGLDALHRNGIVHRDLKPGNVILTPERDGPERPVITDFGLARSDSAPADGSVTGAARLIGSPEYMAPEQFLNASVGKSADIYAFGLIVFEMVAGKRPFPREDLLHAAVRRVAEDAPRLGTVAGDVPAWLDASVARALSREIETRAASAGEVVRGPVEILPGRRISRRALAGMAGSGALISAIGGYAWWRAHPAVPVNPTVAMPDAPEGDSAAEAAVVQMRKVLSQSDAFQLWDTRRLVDIWRRMKGNDSPKPTARDWREIAMRDGVPLIIFTSLNRVGDAYSLDVRIELLKGNPDQPWRHWQKGFEIPDQALLVRTIGEAGNWVRQVLGESESEIAGSSAPESVTTPSWRALTEFTRGERLASSGKREDAIFAYQAAIRIDPDFTMAWMRTGDLEVNLGHEQAGFSAWQKALDTSKRRPLSRREDLHFRSMLASDAADFRQAEQLFREYDRYYPADYYGRFYRVYPLIMLGRVEEGRALLESCLSVRNDSMRRTALAHLVVCALYQGDRSGAEARAKQLGDLGQIGLKNRMAALIHYNYGETDAAVALLKEAAKDPAAVAPERIGYYLAVILADGGRAEDAIRESLDAARANERAGNTEACVRNLVSAAELFIANGQPRDALSSLKGTAAEILSARQYGQAGRVYCLAGAVSDARQTEAKLPDSMDFPLFRIPRLLIEGEVALAEGRAPAAVGLLRSAAAIDAPAFGKEYLAAAYEKAGMRDDAASEYRDVLKGKCFQLGFYAYAPAGATWRAARFLKAAQSSRN